MPIHPPETQMGVGGRMWGSLLVWSPKQLKGIWAQGKGGRGWVAGRKATHTVPRPAGEGADTGTPCNQHLFSTIVLQRYLGLQVPFFFFATICLVNLVFTGCCVPETKGRSLEQIESYFRTGRQSFLH